MSLVRPGAAETDQVEVVCLGAAVRAVVEMEPDRPTQAGRPVLDEQAERPEHGVEVEVRAGDRGGQVEVVSRLHRRPS